MLGTVQNYYLHVMVSIYRISRNFLSKSIISLPFEEKRDRFPYKIRVLPFKYKTQAIFGMSEYFATMQEYDI